MHPNEEQRAAIVASLMTIAKAHESFALLAKSLGAEDYLVEAHMKDFCRAVAEAEDWSVGDEP